MVRFAAWLNNVWRGIGFLQRWLAVILALIISFLIVFQVILRYVLHAPLFGIEEMLIFPTIWLYMLGGANASKQRNHITCDILTLYIRRSVTMKVFNVVKTLLALMISLWLTYWAYGYFIYSLTMWKTSDLLYLPMFFAESAVFIGLLLMTVYTAVELYDNVRLPVSGKNDGRGEESKC